MKITNLSSGRKIAKLDSEKCIGCGECLGNCRFLAIGFEWNLPYETIMEKVSEYALGTMKSRGKTAFINFLENITPLCDCYPFSDSPIVPDIGILASLDPVAVDSACCDKVNSAPANITARLSENSPDKFKALYPKVNWKHKLKYSEKIGLGNLNYELIPV